jgi:hypothetical protein
VAGGFYPGEYSALKEAVERSFKDERGPRNLPISDPANPAIAERTVVAGIVPHAGYIYSGPIAAHFFNKVSMTRPPKTIVILGVNHHGVGRPFSLSDENWRTPLGVIPSDRELMRALALPPIAIDGDAHRLEHSIEVELPFLQYIWPQGISIVALQVTFTDLDLLKEVGKVVSDVIKGKDVLLLASTDFSHYLPPDEQRMLDDMAIESLLTLSPEKLFSTVVRNDISMCGIAPVTVLLAALEGEKHKIELLAKGSSGDTEPMDKVVGYASFAIE